MSIRTARYHGEALAETCGFTGPPIDVEYVARHLRLNVAYAYLGPDVSGLLISRGDVAAIAIQAKDPKNRQRFTIAHEIAHYYLRHQFEPGEHVHVDHGHAITPRNSKSSAGVDLKEIEANQFAAELLMPRKLLGKLRPAMTQDQARPLITRLARDYNVSGIAMSIRLVNLQVIPVY